MKKTGVLLFLASAVVLCLPVAAHAGCTASFTCGGCSERIEECPAPYRPYLLTCNSPAYTLQCTGASSCSVGTSSVTCDGATQSCTPMCFKGASDVFCGTTHRTCAQCQSGQIACPL